MQPFKFLHAVRLCESGLASRAQDYCREIAEYVMRNPTRVESDFLPDFLQQLSHLSERLKYQVCIFLSLIYVYIVEQIKQWFQRIPWLKPCVQSFNSPLVLHLIKELKLKVQLNSFTLIQWFWIIDIFGRMHKCCEFISFLSLRC